MAIVTSTPTASPLSVNGTTRAEGLISWSIPNVPAETKISSCVLTGIATATMTNGNATITVNDQAVTSGEQFSINLGDSNNISSVTVIAIGDIDDAAGTIEFSNLLYTVVYLDSFTVRFFDSDGTLLKEEKVIEGNNSNPPVPPNKDGVVFIGWDNDFKNITSNRNLTARYEAFEAPESKFLTVTASNASWKTGTGLFGIGAPTSTSGTISWTNTGLPSGAVVSKVTIKGNCQVSNTSISVVKIHNTEINTSATTNPIPFEIECDPLSPTSTTMNASHTSSNSSRTITISNITVTLEYYTEASFIARFIDNDGTIISAQKVNSGGAATPPVMENKYGYIFVGWDSDSYHTIVGNTDFTAKYVLPIMRKINLGTFSLNDLFIGDQEIIRAFVGNAAIYNKYYQYESNDLGTIALSITGIVGGDSSKTFSFPSVLNSFPIEEVLLKFHIRVRTGTSGHINSRVLINETVFETYYFHPDNTPDLAFQTTYVDKDCTWSFGTTVPSNIKFSIAGTGGIDLSNNTHVVIDKIQVIVKFA